MPATERFRGLANERTAILRKRGARRWLWSSLAKTPRSIACLEEGRHVPVNLDDVFDASLGAGALGGLGDATENVELGLLAVGDGKDLYRGAASFDGERLVEVVDGDFAVFVLAVGHHDHRVDRSGLRLGSLHRRHVGLLRGLVERGAAPGDHSVDALGERGTVRAEGQGTHGRIELAVE